VTVEDFMIQPFKSYGEFGRSIIRLMCSLAVYETTRAQPDKNKKAKFVMVPGDWWVLRIALREPTRACAYARV